MKNEKPTTNQQIKVAIIDDDTPYREFLKDLLEKESNISLCGEYDQGLTFLRDLESNLKPNVCLIDIVLPDISGIECGKILKQKDPSIMVIIITAYPDQKTITQANSIGADYIEKGTVAEKLIDKIILYQTKHNTIERKNEKKRYKKREKES